MTTVSASRVDPTSAPLPPSSEPAGTSPAAPTGTVVAPGANIPAALMAAVVGTPTPADGADVMDVQLPSRGLPYRGERGEFLIPDGMVKIRMMTGAEEAVINTPGLSPQAQIARVVRACTIFPPLAGGQAFNPNKLITTDRLFVLLMIRSHSLGPKYRLGCTCPTCAHEFTATLDLGEDLDVEAMPRTVTRDGKPFTINYDPRDGVEIVLPVSHYGVKFRLLTGDDEEWITRTVATADDKGSAVHGLPGDPSYYLRMARAIIAMRKPPEVNQPSPDWQPVYPENAKDMADLVSFVSRLPVRDTQALQRRYAETDVAIANGVQQQCPKCEGGVPVIFRMSPEFFRPTDG